MRSGGVEVEEWRCGGVGSGGVAGGVGSGSGVD